MKVPRFEKVFFCLPLRCGVILLVYLNLAVAAFSVLVFGYLDIMGAIERLFTMSFYESLHRTFRSKLHPYVILPVICCFALAEICMTIVVLIGLHKPKPSLVKLYLEFTMILTIFMIIFRMFDISNFMWEVDLAAAIGFMMFKTYYILSLRSLVKKMDVRSEDDKVDIDLTERDTEDRTKYNVGLHYDGDEKVLIINADVDDTIRMSK